MYAVTGVSGKFGRLAVEGLLDAGVDPDQIVAIVRTPSKVADLLAGGVLVRVGDYDEPATLAPALHGVDNLLFVSASEAGKRTPQHRAVVDAAVAAGVQRVAYTSLLRADTSTLSLAAEHKATEEALLASGMQTTLLRNSWYIENYTDQLPTFLAAGTIIGATDNGRVAAATRADYAAAAVAVVTGTGHDGKVYELGGPAFTMTDLANAVTAVTGTTITVTNVGVAEYASILVDRGLDQGTAEFVAALDDGTARGELDTDSTDLTNLLGRSPTSLIAAARAAAS